MRKITNEVIKAVEEMKKTKFSGTYHWYLDRIEGNDWAIVLGWQDGFEVEKYDDCTDDTYRLCMKLAFQPYNSIMQCDYNIDWLMPYDEETGEVDDTEIPLYPDTDIDEVVNWLLFTYVRYKY